MWRRATPLLLKELSWRSIRFVVKCGKSNPLSFALRPIISHSKFRTAVGVQMAGLVLGLSIFSPVPSLASNSSDPELVVAGEGEVVIATIPGVQIPLKNFYVSQRFWVLHPGLDMPAPMGEPIKPIMPGKVVKAEKGWFGYGNEVVISHGEYESLYAHLSQIKVVEGQEVSAETIIGTVGSTGRSTGPHLHLEVAENGTKINPAPLIGVK